MLKLPEVPEESYKNEKRRKYILGKMRPDVDEKQLLQAIPQCLFP